MKPEPLTGQALAAALTTLPHWSGDTTRITRTVRLPPAAAAAVLASVQRTADELDHHPVVTSVGDAVTFEVWTHWVGAVTAKDLALAAEIDRLVGPDAAPAG